MVAKPNKPSEFEIEQLRKAIQKYSRSKEISPAWQKDVSDFSKNAKLTYGEQHNFTYCLIEFRKLQFVGIAKRNPIDEPDSIRAETIALYRAAEDLAKYLAR